MASPPLPGRAAGRRNHGHNRPAREQAGGFAPQTAAPLAGPAGAGGPGGKTRDTDTLTTFRDAAESFRGNGHRGTLLEKARSFDGTEIWHRPGSGSNPAVGCTMSGLRSPIRSKA